MARDDVEVLVSGREPAPPSRPWLRRAGWLAAGLLALGLVVVQDGRQEGTAPPVPTETRAEPPIRSPEPVTDLPDEEVPSYWTVEGTSSGTVTAPLLRSNGRIAAMRVQCIGPGSVQVTAGTGRFVTVECPDAAYESLRFDVTGSFLRGTGTTLADDVAFDIVTSGMAEGSQWRVWTFLPFTII